MPDDTALIREAASSVADVALDGLLKSPKTLPARLFYDEAGCRLFAQITELPEYYLTRTERGLLELAAPRVAAMFSNPFTLVEYGASDEAKAQFLLQVRDASGQPAVQTYVPIDVATLGLARMIERLRQLRPYLQVYALGTDFMSVMALPAVPTDMPRLGFFPGSTIGNLDPSDARRFLHQARRALGLRSRFLLGVDTRKDPAILVPAYDDAAGITAAFNRNLLVRLNREAGADFDPLSFKHRAVWNDDESRIEMHLISQSDQSVQVDGHAIHFARGESIHTENSYKYTPERFAELAEQSGWHCVELWTDAAQLFSLHLLEPRRGP
jgi:dimethylhistidine N-methyltransferase